MQSEYAKEIHILFLQNQPYSFWVTASTVLGEGSESTIVAESPQIPVPATIASFSRCQAH
jgi:hypothetical protein